MDDRVSIRAHFERFPATLKGAFVLRGSDADPHQVRLVAARVVELTGASGQPMGVEPVTLDVAPHLDLFVPFEVPLLDLAPGWYSLELDLAIDGDAGVVRPGEPFAVAWPRGSMWRGSMTVDREISAGSPGVTIRQVEFAADRVRVAYDAAARTGLSLAADGDIVPQIDERFDESSGHGTVMTYPVAKARSRLTITARGADRPVEIDLP